MSEVRPHAEQASNLTRAEARLNLVVLADARDAAADSWIELTPADAPDGAAPTATGRASEPVIVPPGTYQLGLEWRAGPYAIGRGGLRRVELKPAEARGLTIELDFPVGELLIHATSEGQRVDEVDVHVDRVRLIPGEDGAGEGTPVPSTGGGQGRALPPLPAGEVVTLPAGTYRVRVVWTTPAGTTREAEQVVEVRRGRRATADVALGAAAHLARFRVAAGTQRTDITDLSSVRVIQGDVVAAEGPADRAYPLRPGRYDVEVRYERPPLVDEQHVVRAVAIGESNPTVLMVPAETGRLRVHVHRDSNPVDDQCVLAVTGRPTGATEERAGEVPAGEPFPVPAGTWHVTARCDLKNGGLETAVLRDLVVTRGADLIHRLRL